MVNRFDVASRFELAKAKYKETEIRAGIARMPIPRAPVLDANHHWQMESVLRWGVIPYKPVDR